MVGGTAESRSVEVWLADPAYLSRAGAPQREDEAGSGWLSDEERARLDATIGSSARSERLAAYLLVRWALARRLGQRPSDVSISRDHAGRPLPLFSPNGKLEVSITHTRGLVACGVAQNARVGVDAERRRPQALAVAIARRFFSPDELRSLESAPESKRPDQFWALWTLKEAFIKATDSQATERDLFEGLGACAFRVGERGEVEHLFSPTARMPPGRWAFELVAPSKTHYLAAAVGVDGHEELPAVSVRDVTAELSAALSANGDVGE